MYKSIQACRALAAIFVVVFHLGGVLAADKYFGGSAAFLKRLFSFGYCGVAFFFVLSGFIITLIHRKDFGEPTRLSSYLRKRLVRIYPTYIIIFTGVYLIAIAFSSTRGTVPHDPVILIKSILLLPQDKNVVGGQGAPVFLGVAWTLQYEMLFYFAIALGILNRNLLGVVIVAFVLNYLFCAAFSIKSFPQSFFSNKLIFLFLCGILAAYVAKSKLKLGRPLLISAVGGFGFIGLAVIGVAFFKQTRYIDYSLAYGIISGVLIVGLVRVEDSKPVSFKSSSRGTGFLASMGDASYALYLLHLPLMTVLTRALIKAGLHGISGAVIAFAFILSACLFAAWAFYTCVERPILSAFSKPPARLIQSCAPTTLG